MKNCKYILPMYILPIVLIFLDLRKNLSLEENSKLANKIEWEDGFFSKNTKYTNISDFFLTQLVIQFSVNDFSTLLVVFSFSVLF